MTVFLHCFTRHEHSCLWCLTTRLTRPHGFHQARLADGRSDLHVYPLFIVLRLFRRAVWGVQSQKESPGAEPQLSAPWLCRVYWWESGTWELGVGTSRLIMDSFQLRCMKVTLQWKDSDNRCRLLNGCLRSDRDSSVCWWWECWSTQSDSGTGGAAVWWLTALHHVLKGNAY